MGLHVVRAGHLEVHLIWWRCDFIPAVWLKFRTTFAEYLASDRPISRCSRRQILPGSVGILVRFKYNGSSSNISRTSGNLKVATEITESSNRRNPDLELLNLKLAGRGCNQALQGRLQRRRERLQIFLGSGQHYDYILGFRV